MRIVLTDDGSRKGCREGGYGVPIAPFAAIYPVLSWLRAKLDPQ